MPFAFPKISTISYLCFGLAVASGSGAPAEEPMIDFRKEIRPLLADKCFHCHGPDETTRMADLRLDEWESAALVIAPGDPESSELLRRIDCLDADEVMPPPEEGKPLTATEKKLLYQWIAQGASWSTHWAYELPQRYPLPDLGSEDSNLKSEDSNFKADWPRNWIDQFILFGLRRHGLSPSPRADSKTLMRRLSFDLTGLPPKKNSLREPLETEEDYQRFVDSLLSSPHFGERMAVYWLDLVRYADTVGYHGDQDHHIAAYRDWVIDAFNSSQPFDAMTRDQLAGDLVDQPTLEQKIATGYNRVLQTTHEGGLQPGEYRAIYAADRVRNLADVWLAATVGCAQCHDHKFDPYSMRDFYSFAAFFADIDDEDHFRTGTNSLPTKRHPEIELPTDEQIAEMSRLRQAIAELESPSQPGTQSSQTSGSPPNDQLQSRKMQLERDLKKIQGQVQRSMITVALATPKPTRILPRGNWMDDSGALVQPAFPEFLPRPADPAPSGTGHDSHDDHSSHDRLNRLDLAEWLTGAEDGIGLLTARVMVNRLWYLLFGRGLAPDLADFGGQGEYPTHPELLDNLAFYLVDSGWDIKATVRLIVCSQSYRQASAIEDGSISGLLAAEFGRQSAYRLPAEMIRDNALSISQLLIREIGGPSARPYQPEGYYQHLNFPVRKYHADRGPQQWRRGVYVHWQRQFLHPMLKAFDATNREECTAQRSRSNTPLAALSMLNDPSFVEAARALAEAAVRENPGASPLLDQQRVAWIFEVATGRTPKQAESQTLQELLGESRAWFDGDPQRASLLLSVGIKPIESDIRPIELAAWTEVCRAILNLSETNMRP